MKKQTLLLSALALSIGLSLSVLPPAAASLPTQVPGQGALPSLAPMLEKVLPAVVSVQVEGTASPVQNMPEELKKYFGDNAPQEQAQPFEGLGSGVIIDAAKGYVLTNNHVISQAQKISIQLNDGREFDAKLVGSDEQSDIALLQVLKPSNLTQIAIADSDKLRVGDFAVAVGNPFGLGQTATSGIISALGRSGLNLEGLENFIQTDASINRGNSGGALVNSLGELMGINTLSFDKSNDGETPEGIGFAIPFQLATKIMDKLIRDGRVIRGYIGISGREIAPMHAQSGGMDQIQGIVVNDVAPDGPAAQAGIRANDVIISVNDKPAVSALETMDQVAEIRPGSEIPVVIMRDDKKITLHVAVQEYPATN